VDPQIFLLAPHQDEITFGSIKLFSVFCNVRLYHGNSLGSNPDISKKMGYISKRAAFILLPAQKKETRLRMSHEMNLAFDDMYG
jgi:hypothetical protein